LVLVLLSTSRESAGWQGVISASRRAKLTRRVGGIAQYFRCRCPRSTALWRLKRRNQKQLATLSKLATTVNVQMCNQAASDDWPWIRL